MPSRLSFQPNDRLSRSIGTFPYDLRAQFRPSIIRPQSDGNNSKYSNYAITDQFTRFWLRYLFKYGCYIELEAYDTLIKIAARDLPVLEGVVFEGLVRIMLAILGRLGAWDHESDEIGHYWDRTGLEIDLVAVDRAKGHICWRSTN